MRKKAEMVHNGQVNVPNIKIEYKGFHIVPKRDFGRYPYQDVNTYRKGYIVVEDGVSIMPGGTWSPDVIGAKVMIDCYLEAERDGQTFWSLMGKMNGTDEYEEV